MQISRPDWVEALFAVIDARDTEGFLAFLSPQVVFRFANAPPGHGVDDTRRMVAGFFASITALRHRLDDVWITADGVVIVRGDVRYTRLDGSTLAVPFATVFRRDDRGIREYSIYVDASAL